MDVTDVYQGRCFTEVKIERAQFEWKINDFSRTTELLKSSVFPSSTPENIGKWCVSLWPNKTHVTGYEHYNRKPKYSEPHIYIEVHQLADIDILAAVKISLIDDEGSVVKSEVTGWIKFNLNTKTNFDDFLSCSDLKKINGCLPNDELTILCEIEIKRSSENRYHESDPAKLKRPLCQLAEDMGKLFSSKSLTDLTITVGERRFRAHKAILAARSPVFAAMFRNQMVEKKFNAVKITDIHPDVFQQMLEFIYTGKEISQTNRTTELLAAANKYQLDRMKLLCEEALCKVLSVDNVLENIVLAELYKASYLKKYALNFVMKNSSNVIRSSAWEIFKRSHQSLVMEILENIGSKLTF